MLCAFVLRSPLPTALNRRPTSVRLKSFECHARDFVMTRDHADDESRLRALIRTGRCWPRFRPFGRGLRNTNAHNISPRAGLAWRLPDSTRTVLRAGYGISYIEEVGGNNANPIQNPPNAFRRA